MDPDATNSKIVYYNKELILYHTMRTFDALEEKSLLKTLWENKKMLVTNVFYPMKDNSNILSNI